MSHFDTVISSRPTAYFPLQQSTENNGTGGQSAVGLWTPQSIETSAWWDASDESAITLSDGRVSLWKDKSGDNDAYQANRSRMPTWVMDSLGGLPAVRFRGTPLKIDKASWSGTIGIFAVTRKSSLSPALTGFILDASTSTSFASSRGFRFDSYGTTQRFGVSSDGTGSFAQVSQQYNDTFIQKAAWYDGSTIRMQNHSNGTVYTSSAESGPISYTGVAETTLGGYLSTSTYLSLYGDIAELIVLPESPTTQIIDSINHYFSTKWGTEMNPNSQYLSTEPPAPPQYEEFRLSDSSRYSVNLAGGGLSLASIIPSLSRKLWKRGITFECLFFPDDGATLFETVDSYYSGSNQTYGRIISVRYEKGKIIVRVGDSVIYSNSFSSTGARHVSVTISSETVSISVDGTSMGYGDYSDFDLYGHELKDIVVYGTGHVSDIALYAGAGGSGWSATGNDIRLVSGPESLTYALDQESIELSTSTISPLGTSWQTSSNVNLELGDTATTSDSVVINYSGPRNELSSVIPLSSSLELVGAQSLISAGDSVRLVFTLSSYNTNDYRTILYLSSQKATLHAYVYDGVFFVSLESPSDVTEYTENFAPVIGTEYTLVATFLSDSLIVSLSDTTVKTELNLDKIFIDMPSSSLSISSDTTPLVGELCSAEIIGGGFIKWRLDTNRLIGISSGYADFYVGDSDSVIWVPNNESVESSQAHGDPSPTPYTRLTLRGSQHGSTDLYEVVSLSYGDLVSTPVNGDDELMIRGGFTPALESGPVWRQNPLTTLTLRDGYLEVAPNKLATNYINDFSFSRVEAWTPSNCIISVESNPLLSGGYGVWVDYTSQAPKVTSENIYVLPSTGYAAAVNLRVIPGPSTVSLNIEWYNASNALISTTTGSLSVMTVPETIYVAGTSPSTAKFCRVSVSTPSSTGSILLDSIFLGRTFGSDYNNFYSGFNSFSALFRAVGDFYIFSHQYLSDYFIRVANGVLTFSGFSEVRINNVIKSSGADISDHTGMIHVSAINNDGIMRPSQETPAYIGRSHNGSVPSGSAAVAMIKFSNGLDTNEYNYLCGDPSVGNADNPDQVTVTLNNDNVLAVSDAWTIIR